jgi:hypothetical protein
MVGLLCPDEPLPPETIQHYATYLALVATIRTELENEIDTFKDWLKENDLLDGYDDTIDDDDRILTGKELEEHIFNMDLISRQVEKNKKNIDRDTRPVEEFQAPAATEPNRSNSAQIIASILSSLFAGPPVSTEAHRLHPLNSEETHYFELRLLVDEALYRSTHTE